MNGEEEEERRVSRWIEEELETFQSNGATEERRVAPDSQICQIFTASGPFRVDGEWEHSNDHRVGDRWCDDGMDDNQ